jgi:drug/metabolite transporter (DMT)-like permease
MKSLIGSTYLSLAAISWGISQVISKYVLEEIPPFTLTLLRFILASLAVGIFLFFESPVKIKRKDLLQLSILGLIGYTLSIGLQ